MPVSGFDDRNLKAIFYSQLEEVMADSWPDKIALRIASDRQVEDYRFVGNFPGLREWIGERDVKSMDYRPYEIRNRKYEATTELFEDDIRRDKPAQMGESWIDRVIRNFAREAVIGHFGDLLVDLINTNGVCLDGQNFFDTDHTWNMTGTWINEAAAAQIPSANIATATAPTPLEMATVMLGSLAYMMSARNARGRAINQTARSFVLLCPTAAIYSAAITATGVERMAGDVDNPLRGLITAGYSIMPQFEPRLENGDANDDARFVLLRADGDIAPFIIQEELAPEASVLGPGSDHHFKRDSRLLGVKAVNGAGYGLPTHALRVTLS